MDRLTEAAFGILGLLLFVFFGLIILVSSGIGLVVFALNVMGILDWGWFAITMWFWWPFPLLGMAAVMHFLGKLINKV